MASIASPTRAASSSASRTWSMAWPTSVAKKSVSPSTPKDASSTAACSNADLGPCSCTVLTDTPASRASWENVVAR